MYMAQCSSININCIINTTLYNVLLGSLSDWLIGSKKIIIYFFLPWSGNIKETFHCIILQTLGERYFWMFSEHSETSQTKAKTFQKKIH